MKSHSLLGERRLWMLRLRFEAFQASSDIVFWASETVFMRYEPYLRPGNGKA